jgi:hypothetical protein
MITEMMEKNNMVAIIIQIHRKFHHIQAYQTIIPSLINSKIKTLYSNLTYSSIQNTNPTSKLLNQKIPNPKPL